MSLYDDAKLIQIPSGYKAGELYSVKPNTAAGDFDVARTSIATRVNSDLQLESMAANVPLLSYVGGECPYLETHGAITNLITYSNDFSNAYWTKSGATLTGGQASPSKDYPLESYKLTEDGSTGLHEIHHGSLTVMSGATTTLSAFAKADERNWLLIYESQSGEGYFFDLTNGVVGSISGGTPDDYSIIPLAVFGFTLYNSPAL